ncbi:MAG: hypothetical protein SGI77_18245, partial [Pirellulaceae bacterium]|nr:hypothetical protein [Pirellulaceae bacterium]
ALPEWKRADQSSLDLENGLILCPSSSSASIDTPLSERLDTQGCQLIFGESDRNKTLLQIDGLVGGQLSNVRQSIDASADSGNSDSSELDLTGSPKQPIGIEDFYALGFAYLMLQALTRKVHYSSNLDVVLMADQAKSASMAYIANDVAECERWLQSCYDQLSQERDRYFTQSANLLELTLLAPSTLGRSLVQQLESSHPQNLLATASLLEQIQSSHPEAWQTLLDRQTNQRLGIVGGLLRERSHPWFPLGTLQRDLIRGHVAYQALRVAPPRVFSRFEAGMSIEMPTHLSSTGYIGALIHAFSNGSYPVTSQAKIAWESSDKTSLDAISGSVLDAASYRSIFNAINELAKQFDHHQVPTLTCVHWPARTSIAFNDLLRATRRTNAFGEWKTFENYFESTGYVYSNQNFTASQFKTPWPEWYDEFSAQSLQFHERLRVNAALESTRNIAVMIDQILQSIPNRESDRAKLAPLLSQIDQLLYQSDDQNHQQNTASTDPLHAHSIDELRSQLADQLANLLPRTSDTSDSNDNWLLINPLSGPRRYFLKDIDGAFAKTADNRIYESISSSNKTDLVVDVPPMGVVQLRSGAASNLVSSAFASRSLGPNLASPNLLLANEFIECQVDPKNGYLRSIMISKKRGGRLSGMPAIALIDPSSPKKPIYSTIENARSTILNNTALHSEIESIGFLSHHGKQLAKFHLTFGLWRGSRSIDMRLRIEMLAEDISNPRGLWDCVPIWRTAWPNQAASISAWLQGTKTAMQSSPFFAPELLEIDDAEHRIYLTFAGLPIHRRVEMAFLDTLLPTTTDGVCDHRWQIAVDWPRPYQSYLESLDTPWMIKDPSGPLRAGSSLWFAQASSANVRVDPLASSNRLRLMLHETMGKEGRTKLSFFRDATSAARVDHQGNTIEDLQIENGQVIVELRPNEISYLDVG